LASLARVDARPTAWSLKLDQEASTNLEGRMESRNDTRSPERSSVSRTSPLPRWIRYGAAVAMTVLVTLLARELEPYWDVFGRHPYLIEWPMVIAAAWLGGLGPGLVADALATLAILFFWIEPRNSLLVSRPTDFLALGLFAGCGVVVSALIERLHRARQREQTLRRSRELVLGVVAHDLRNPLNSILVATSVLQRKTHDERLDLVQRAARRMDHLIRDLVDASKLDSDGTLSMVQGPETLDSIVDEAVGTVSASTGARSIQIHSECSAGIRLCCDRDRVLQVLGNLLDNAVKFTPEHGRIHVRAARLRALVRIEVTDSGPGIKAEHQARVFDRHWSGGVAGAGAGLGLFIAHGIVRAHGGTLWLHSEPGHGTSFFFTLPALDDEAQPQKRPSERSARLRLL
jgi:signal transduction histidine kinase